MDREFGRSRKTNGLGEIEMRPTLAHPDRPHSEYDSEGDIWRWEVKTSQQWIDSLGVKCKVMDSDGWNRSDFERRIF